MSFWVTLKQKYVKRYKQLKCNHETRLKYQTNCTTPRRLSPTIAIGPVHIATKDVTNHHTYAKQMKVTSPNRYKSSSSRSLKK